jgi:hypothetical protein
MITRPPRRKRHFYNGEKISVADGDSEKEYSLAFGKATYDFTDVGNTVVKLSVAFGASIVKINKKAAVKVVVNTAFGSSKTPDGAIISFGQHEYTTPSFSKEKKYLLVEIDLAFGSVVVE